MKEELLLEQSFEEYGISHRHQEIIRRRISDPLRECDEETWRHSVRVAVLAPRIGAHVPFMRLPALYWAGLCHDAGKAMIKDPAVLKKQKEFTPEDMEVVEDHVALGVILLLDLGFVFTAHIVKYHHQFQDRPYPSLVRLPQPPDALSGHEQLFRIHGRVLALADSFDALMHRNNDKFDGAPLATSQKRALYFEKNRDQESLIRILLRECIISFSA